MLKIVKMALFFQLFHVLMPGNFSKKYQELFFLLQMTQNS